MKSSTERTGCDNGSDSSGGSRKLYEQCHLLGIIDCVKIFYSLSYFSIETTKVLVKVKFFKSHFSYRNSKANSFNIKHIPPALAGPLIVFNLDIRKFWLT